MRNYTKLLLTALSAALVLGAAVGTASARRLEVSNTGIRAVWSALTFTSEAGGEGIEAICSVTLEGTFHSRTISKVSGQLIGYITRAILNRPGCRFRTATDVSILTATLPWHVRYDSFQGTLPSITGVRLQLINASFSITAFGLACLYSSTAASPAFGIAGLNAAGESTGLRADETRTIPRFSGGILCPSSGFFKGTSAAVTLLGTATVIRIRLVL